MKRHQEKTLYMVIGHINIQNDLVVFDDQLEYEF
jgi:hypothetical protein